MKFKTKVKAQFHKRYFDEGYGTLHYLKLPLTIFGISGAITGKYMEIILIVSIYGIFCYFFGRFMIKHRWTEAGIEVGNKINLFVKQMRRKIK